MMTSKTMERWEEGCSFLFNALCYSDEEIVYNGDLYRIIPGETHYFASKYGEVIGVFNGRVTKLKTWTNQYGHEYVSLYGENGPRRKKSVHRIVAETFIDNPRHYPVVMHMDDNPRNNCVENLKWGTQADNVKDCIDRQRNYVRSVYCHELNKVFRSCAEAADYFGVTRGSVTFCCKGLIHSLKGMHLCYLEDASVLFEEDFHNDRD